MEPFNLEKAKAGKPVTDTYGNKIRILCLDAKIYHSGVQYPVVALVEYPDGEESVETYTSEGKFDNTLYDSMNLYMEEN